MKKIIKLFFHFIACLAVIVFFSTVLSTSKKMTTEEKKKAKKIIASHIDKAIIQKPFEYKEGLRREIKRKRKVNNPIG